MATVGVGTKYHCAVNGVGYLVGQRGYLKKDAPVFTPRFGTGEQGLNDLDLFKSWAQDDFSGGSFQDHWGEDISKTSLLTNLYYNSYDKLIYNTPTRQSVTPMSTWVSSLTSKNPWAVYKKVLYFGVVGNGTGAAACSVWKYNPSTRTFTSVKTDFATGFPTSLVVVGNTLWVAMGGSGGIWSYDGTTWTQDTRYGFRYMMGFNGKLYANGNTSTTDSGRLFARDTTAGSGGPAATVIGDVGDVNIDFNSLVVYNHRLYIGKADGLYAYDGTLVSTVLDYSNSYDTTNFRTMAVHEGILYFARNTTIYRFNGSTVEKIREFARYETIKDMLSTGDKLMILTDVIVGGTEHGSVGAGNVYAYNGLGWYLYSTGTQSSAEPSLLAFISDDTYRHLLSGFSSAINFTTLKAIELVNEFAVGATEVGTILTSEFDAAFPNSDKYFDRFIMNYDGIATNDSIVVSFRTHNGTAWTAFQTLGTITSASASNILNLFETAYSGTFKKIQFKIVVTRDSASSLAIRSYQMNYYLSPDQTWTWQLKLLCFGTVDTPFLLADNTTNEAKTAAQLRDNIYTARQTDAPIGFEDVDFTTLNGAHNSAVTTINVGSAYSFRSAGYIKIDDEIIKYTGKTATTITGCTRGALGTSAASHSSAAIVNAYFRVTVKSIDQESVIAPNQELTTGQESELSITLQEAPSA